MPSRTVTLDANGNAYVPFFTIRVYLILVKNPFSGAMVVNMGAGNQVIDAGNSRTFVGEDLTNFNGYIEISGGSPNLTIEVFYETYQKRRVGFF